MAADGIQWGETQNLLSVIIGLNLAYTAIKELRISDLTRVKGWVDTGCSGWRQTYLKDTPEGKTVLDEYDRLRRTINGALRAISRAEARFDRPAVFAALLSIICLILSTVYFREPMATALFCAIVLVGFFPVAGLLYTTYFRVISQYRHFSAEFDRLERECSRVISPLLEEKEKERAGNTDVSTDKF